MTKEEKAKAFDEIMVDADSLDDKPHRLFLTLLRYVDVTAIGHGVAQDALLRAYYNAHKLLDRT